MTPFVTFIGWHNSGKTTLIRKVVHILGQRGHKIGVMKSTKHTDLGVDRPGTDSSLLRADGVPGVAVLNPAEILLFEDRNGEDLRHLGHRLFPWADLIVGEGFKRARGIPKIEVTRTGISDGLLRDEIPEVIAVVADFEVSGGPAFRIDDAAAVADFVEERFLLAEGPKEAVSLFVNGRPVALNRFVQSALAGTVTGFVRCLRCEDEADTIELRIKLNSSDLKA